MTRCYLCGNDSTERAGMYRATVACTYPGCYRGYSECQGCTRYRGSIVKCCGWCSPLGKIKCERCDGTGIKEVYQVCTGTHRQPTPPGSGRRR